MAANSHARAGRKTDRAALARKDIINHARERCSNPAFLVPQDFEEVGPRIKPHPFSSRMVWVQAYVLVRAADIVDKYALTIEEVCNL